MAKSFDCFTFVTSKIIVITKFFDLTAFKGISAEVWFNKSIKSLKDLKVLTNFGVPASQNLQIEQNYFPMTLRSIGITAGIRIRTFFLCSLTGIYKFVFSCFGACEWFIKESENKEVNITGGSSRQGMQQQEFKA